MAGGIRNFKRITLSPNVMGGKPCIRGLRVTVKTITELLASGYSSQSILKMYPYLEETDITEALLYTAKKEKYFKYPAQDLSDFKFDRDEANDLE